MQGVEILNEIAMDELTVGMTFLFVICVILTTGSITSTISGFFKWGGWDIINSVLLTIGMIFMIASIFIYNNGSRNYWTEYEVTIDENVKLLEFLEVYEIVDQDGKIFTVKEVK